jgi:hypothetical protein
MAVVGGKECGSWKTNLEEKWTASTLIKAIVHSLVVYIITHVK